MCECVSLRVWDAVCGVLWCQGCEVWICGFAVSGVFVWVCECVCCLGSPFQPHEIMIDVAEKRPVNNYWRVEMKQFWASIAGIQLSILYYVVKRMMTE